MPSAPAVPAAWYHGEAAQKELAAATRVKGQDEVPPASAYDAVAEPPEIREEEYGGCRPTPHVTLPIFAPPSTPASLAFSRAPTVSAACVFAASRADHLAGGRLAANAGASLDILHAAFLLYSAPSPACTPPSAVRVEWGAGPAAYVNRYRHAWPAAVAAINAAIDDAKRRRHRGGIWVPTGTCGRLTVPELPAPLGMPRFTWEQVGTCGRQGPGTRCRR